MKNDLFIAPYEYKKEQIKDFAKRMMLLRMTYENVKEFLPKDWILEPMRPYNMAIMIKPPEDVNITIDEFEKIVARIAKKLNLQPDIRITEYILEATFYCYVRHNLYISAPIDIVVGNTEKCEITYTNRVVSERTLTGYCKVLAEKQFISNQS